MTDPRFDNESGTDFRFFTKHQRHLLWFVNTRIGRRFFGVNSHPANRVFFSIFPNALHWQEGRSMKAEILITNLYANRVRWWIRWAKWFAGGVAVQAFGREALSLIPLMVGSAVTFYTSASAISGRVVREGAIDQTWAAIQAGAGTNASLGAIILRWSGSATANQFDALNRGIVNFDTTSIGSGATITAADIYLKPTQADAPSDATASRRAIHIAGSTVASTSTLATTDYANTGGTTFGSVSFASLVLETFSTFALNASGLAAINKTGVSKFSVKIGADIDNDSPTTTGTNDDYRVDFRGYADGTEASRPKIIVTYTPVIYTLTLTETLTATDTISKSESRVLAESVTLTDTISNQHIKYITLTEAISLTESFVTTYWQKRTKPSTSWADRTEPSSSWTNRTKPTTPWG